MSQHDLEFYNFLCWKMIINSSRIYAKLTILNECGSIIEIDAFWLYVVRCRRWLWVSLVKQELLTLPEHLSSPLVFSGVRVTRSLALYVCFVDRCLSFCTFYFGHCVLWSSSIYGFWLPLWYLQTLLVDHYFSCCLCLSIVFSPQNENWNLLVRIKFLNLF